MDISLAGLLGAVLGVIVAAVIYAPLAGAIERRMLEPASAEPQERATLEKEIGLLRRGVFIADMLLCTGIGYWIGQKIGG
jgi:hypothetical protein